MNTNINVINGNETYSFDQNNKVDVKVSNYPEFTVIWFDSWIRNNGHKEGGDLEIPVTREIFVSTIINNEKRHQTVIIPETVLNMLWYKKDINKRMNEIIEIIKEDLIKDIPKAKIYKETDNLKIKTERMIFSELNDILQLKLKKVCRLNENLNGWLPSSNDYVVLKDGKVDTIFSKGLEINFKDNKIESINNIF